MPDEQKTAPREQDRSKSAKGAIPKPRLGGATGNTVAETQGSYEQPSGSAEDVPGTKEHLGSDRPYEGAEGPEKG